MRKKLYLGIIISLGFIIITSYSFTQQTQDEVLIVGKWQSESDSNSVIVFSSTGIEEEYYKGVRNDTYNYYLSITPPDCGDGIIQNDPKVETYLKMVNTKDSNDIYCYYIDGLSDEILCM